MATRDPSRPPVAPFSSLALLSWTSMWVVVLVCPGLPTLFLGAQALGSLFWFWVWPLP